MTKPNNDTKNKPSLDTDKKDGYGYEKRLRRLSGKPNNDRKFIGFDIETYGKRNKFLLGCVSHPDDTVDTFHSRDKMIDSILTDRSTYKKTWIVATNLMFDLYALFGDTDIFKDFDLCFRGSDLINARLNSKYKDRRLMFVDTGNWFGHTSVHNLGKMLSLPKLDTPSFLGKKYKTMHEKEQLSVYCQRDAEISRKSVEFLRDAFTKLKIKMRMTIASTSMDCYRRLYQPHSYLTPDTKKILYLMKGYRGGRTECFKRGYIEGNLRSYDINSAYLWGLTQEYPVPDSIKTGKATRDIVDTYEGVCEAVITVPDNTYLPYIPLKIDKLLFPVGTFRNHYSFMELRKCIDLGYDVKIVPKTCVYYTKKSYLFRDFANDMFDQRLEYKRQKSNMQLVFKVVGNSLYGKWAQRITDKSWLKHKTVEMCNDDYIKKMQSKGIEMHPLKNNDDVMFFKQKINTKYPDFINPIISIHTISLVRNLLFDSMTTLGHNKVFYCDTDSITTTGYLDESKKIGGLKEEYSIKDAVLVRPKMYLFNTNEGKTIIKMKGVKRSALVDDDGQFSEQKFFTVLGDREVNIQKFVKWKEAVRSAKGRTCNQIIKMTKKIDLEDNKRIWEYPRFTFDRMQDSEALNVQGDVII